MINDQDYFPNKCEFGNALIVIPLGKEKRMGAIHRQNNGETAQINIEHPLMKEDQKSQSTRPAVQTHLFP